MSISIRLANIDNQIGYSLSFPHDVDKSTLNLSSIDLDFRKNWNSPSIRESLWELVTLINKHQTSSNKNTILINSAGFLVAKLLFPQINSPSEIIEIPPRLDLEQIKKILLQSGMFINYIIKKETLTAKVVFHPSFFLPSDLSISTPLTFPENTRGLLLTFDKNGWWNPLGGHIEGEESWQETLQREAQEEGGVEIDNIKVFGYVKVENLTGQKFSEFPPVSQIPLTTSHITKYQEEWTPLETTNRQFFSPKETYEALKIRTDNGQMLQIYSYLLFLKNKNIL